MKAYVINLKKRPDRLNRFMENIGNYLKNTDLEIIEGIDGQEIDPYDDFHRKNVNPWNYKHLNDKSLRGVIGCCRSHMKAYEKIISDNVPYALIFEDDAYPSVESEKIEYYLDSLEIPEKFSVIYLNKFRKSPVNNRNFTLKEALSPKGETAESYIISNHYAKIVYDYCKTNIGAIDAHIDQCHGIHKEEKHFSTIDEIFYQYDRRDSNIR